MKTVLSLFRKRRSRYIPKAVRQAVRKRDKNRCLEPEETHAVTN